MKVRAYLLHALSPVHPGTGQGVGSIDLPIARETVTGHPFIPGTTVKGVLRAELRPGNAPPRSRDAGEDWANHWAMFGPETVEASEHAGAVTVTDARLLCLPVRSLRGTFAWVTSPLALRRFRRDLAETDLSRLPSVGGITATHQAATAIKDSALVDGGRVYLEDLDVSAQHKPWVASWAEVLAPWLYPGDEDWQGVFKARLLVVSDEVFDFLSETATQVDTRVRIDPTTGTVARGQLWTEESIPAEAILAGLVAATPSRRKAIDLTGSQLLTTLTSRAARRPLQMGGMASVGRGRMRMYIHEREGGAA